MTAPLQKGRLGRGLASLIGEPTLTEAKLPPEGEQRLIPIEQLSAGKLNPRRDFNEEELIELTESIRQKGLVQPLIVRPRPGAGYGFEIVAGERRWRAAQRAGLHTIPAIVRALDDKEALEIAIIENVQRADLNAIEEAAGYRDLMERFDYSQERLAEVIGKSRSHVANTLRLLKLPESVQALVQEGKLTAGHARALVGRDDAEPLARRALEQELNVREMEALVQALDSGDEEPLRRVREKDPNIRALEKELVDTLGLRVEIKRGSGGSGALIIKYGNLEQFDFVRARLLGE